MTDKEKLETVMNFLLENRNSESLEEIENFDPMRDTGGNFNDAYETGIEIGRALMIEEVLELLK